LKIILNLFFFRYFRCLANGQVPPVKERLEVPVATQKTDTGLTNGIIKTLHRQVFYFFLICLSKAQFFILFFFQLSILSKLDLKTIEEKWRALNLPKEKFDIIVQLGNFHNEVIWLKFLPICCSTISKVNNVFSLLK